jgi:hypothetical protein
MSIEANYVLGAIAVGIGATLVMDLWNHLESGVTPSRNSGETRSPSITPAGLRRGATGRQLGSGAVR